MQEYKITKSIGTEKQNQLKYNQDAKADKKLDVLPTPINVISDAHTAAVQVGKGNLCRVFGTAGTDVVAFDDSSTMAQPTTSTATAAMLSLSCQIFVASGEFIRTSNGVTRVEVIED